MVRAVLDTSTLVATVISPHGPNAQVFDLITAGRIVPCVSDVILNEYRRGFSYDRLQHLDPHRVATLCGLLEAVAIKVRPRRVLHISEHEDDNRIYECAA